MIPLLLACATETVSDSEVLGDSSGPALPEIDALDALSTRVVLPGQVHTLLVEDLDGDGHDDLVGGMPGYHRVGNEGAVALMSGPLEAGEHSELDGLLVGSEEASSLGSSLATVDLEQDGTLELVVAAQGQTATTRDQGAVLFMGVAPLIDGSLDGHSTGRALGRGIGDHLGQELAVGDFDDDGLPEVAAGAPYAFVEDRFGAGVVVLLGAPIEEDYDLDTLDGIEGSFDRGELGWALAAGDLDGDGIDDLAVCAANQGDDGALLVYSGPIQGVLTSMDGLTIDAERDEPDFTRGVEAGDVDGDGFDDLLVTVGPEFEASATPATTWLIPGPPEAGNMPDRALASFVASELELLHTQGQHVLVEDIDGDGLHDVVIGNTEAPSEGGEATAGHLRLWYGPLTGQLVEPDWERAGTSYGQALGRALGFGDLDDRPGGEISISSWSTEGDSMVLLQPLPQL